jgi:hypothetical protein
MGDGEREHAAVRGALFLSLALVACGGDQFSAATFSSRTSTHDAGDVDTGSSSSSGGSSGMNHGGASSGGELGAGGAHGGDVGAGGNTGGHSGELAAGGTRTSTGGELGAGGAISTTDGGAVNYGTTDGQPCSSVGGNLATNCDLPALIAKGGLHASCNASNVCCVNDICGCVTFSPYCF